MFLSDFIATSIVEIIESNGLTSTLPSETQDGLLGPPVKYTTLSFYEK